MKCPFNPEKSTSLFPELKTLSFQASVAIIRIILGVTNVDWSILNAVANTKTTKDAIELENKYNHLKRLSSFNHLRFSPSTATKIPSSTLQFSVLYLLYQLRATNSVSSLNGAQQSVISEAPQHMLISDINLRPVPLSQQNSVATSATEKRIREKVAQHLPHRHIHEGEIFEHFLVRDLVFVLQGLDGQYFKYNAQTDRYELPANANVPRSRRILSQKIAELGSLFAKVRTYLEKTQVSHSSASSHLGLIAQAFRQGIDEEIKTYYQMIAKLESHVSLRSKQNNNVGDSDKNDLEDTSSPMTLRQLAIWTSEPMRRMRWLYMVVENDLGGASNGGSTGLNELSVIRDQSSSASTGLNARNGVGNFNPGGRHDLAASRMHQLTQLRAHADPYLHSLGLKLEVETSRPVLNMIQNWIFQGTLNDPYKEFFVIKNDSIVPKVSGLVGEASKLDANFWNWSEQYLVLHSRIPPFISHRLAHKIMVIGKSINFMKTCCGDADWIAEHTRKVLKQELPAEGVHSFDELRQPIHTLYETINARLVQLILDKFHLMHHIEAIRKYLFLGQGDLIQVLMESLEPELSLPVGKQYRHNLLPIVDGAIRSSVANSWPSYLQDKCEIYLPSAKELSQESSRLRSMGHGATASSAGGYGSTSSTPPVDGWDVFELKYQLSSPLDAILGTPAVNTQHRAIFRFLWRLRRVQHVLTSTWRLTTNCSRQLTFLVPEIAPLMQQVHLLRHQMTHFTSNIQYYIMFEVLETAWQALETKIKKAKSLDDIVDAYAQYVTDIIQSSLIDDPHAEPLSQEECIEQGYEQELTPAAMIWEALSLIRDFDEKTQDIYTSSHEVAVRRESARTGEPVYDDDGEPQWGVSAEDEQLDIDFLDHLDNVLTVGIETISDQYRHAFDQLFTSLAHRMKEGDNQYLRNLFQRINYNCYYASEAPTHLTTNPENASAILQATLGSIKDVHTNPNSVHATSASSGPGSNFMSPGMLSGMQSGTRSAANGGSSGGTLFSPPLGSASASSSAYTENLLKQAAAKLRLSTLNASAHNRTSSGGSDK